MSDNAKDTRTGISAGHGCPSISKYTVSGDSLIVS